MPRSSLSLVLWFRVSVRVRVRVSLLQLRTIEPSHYQYTIGGWTVLCSVRVRVSDSLCVSVNFVVNIMFEIAGHEVPLAYSAYRFMPTRSWVHKAPGPWGPGSTLHRNAHLCLTLTLTKPTLGQGGAIDPQTLALPPSPNISIYRCKKSNLWLSKYAKMHYIFMPIVVKINH